MSNGLGAGFGGFMLFVVLTAIAGLLLATTVVAFYWRHSHSQVSMPIQYIVVVLIGSVIAVAGFGVLALIDEAPLIAVLFGANVDLPLIIVAGRARWVGVRWITVATISGMAWSLPFLVGAGMLYLFTVNTEISAQVMTVLVSTVTIGGALIVGELIGSWFTADYPIAQT